MTEFSDSRLLLLNDTKNEVINMGRLAYDNIEVASRAVRENSQELVDRIYELEKKLITIQNI